MSEELNTSTNAQAVQANQSAKQMLVGIVGGGNGGTTFYRIINDCSTAKVAFVCDLNPNAPLMLNARQRGIKTFTDMSEATSNITVDLVIETTGISKVEQILRNKYPPGNHTKIIDSNAALFFVRIMEDFFGETADINTQKDRYLSFKIGGENYAVDIALVSEINSTTATTPLPSSAAFFKGIINLRGRIIPIIDLAVLLGIDRKSEGEVSCNVIVNVGDRPYGLLVDKMNGVVDIPDEYITRSSELLSSRKQTFLKGIGKVDNEVIIVIDLDQLMKNKQELKDININQPVAA
ncbi:MAG: purine-binding chemotaxis protein CheW [Oligoflexia bacterium]|nr:purine-binding chemotaxis protein CheW [Oligoflexia bacterium]